MYLSSTPSTVSRALPAQVGEQWKWEERGQVVESENTIVLEGVPIVTPNKDVVASRLTFQVSW